MPARVPFRVFARHDDFYGNSAIATQFLKGEGKKHPSPAGDKNKRVQTVKIVYKTDREQSLH